MSKMYLYNSSETLNLIVTMSTYSFQLPPQAYQAVESTDPNVAKFISWYPVLSLVANVPNQEQKAIVGDFTDQALAQNPDDLMETARALEKQMNATRITKQAELSATAKQLEDDSIEKADIKESMTIDTARALENQMNDLSATAKGLEEQKKTLEAPQEVKAPVVPEAKAKQEQKPEPKVESKKSK